MVLLLTLAQEMVLRNLENYAGARQPTVQQARLYLGAVVSRHCPNGVLTHVVEEGNLVLV
jgi:hypothetical protein